MWLSCFSNVQLCVTLWTVAQQAPMSTGFSREEYWSGLPHPRPGDLSSPGIKFASLCLLHGQVGFLPLVPPGKPYFPITSLHWDIKTQCRK